MRVSIQTADNIITIDGKAHHVDCTGLRGRNISAVQWYGELGEVEFIGHKQPNQTIRSLGDLQYYVDEAKPIPEPEPPTPDELQAQHQAYMARHPNARAAWDERDAALTREAEMRRAEIEKGEAALESGETAAKPLPGQPIAAETQTQPKPKTKPKKK
jgi:hypothetical protein